MRLFLILLVTMTMTLGTLGATFALEQPNVVIVLCDDLGYGDIETLNSNSKIQTPSLNQLAQDGMSFTDAHSGSAVCTPTRYGLLCGRYCWRTYLKRGVLGGYSKPLIAKNQPTLASITRSSGYQTACIGKWHLGLGWQSTNVDPDNAGKIKAKRKNNAVDFSKPLTDSPVNHGFDYSYIIPASLDMSPYVYIENDRALGPVTSKIKGQKFPKFYRAGAIADGFEIIQCLDHLADRAAGYISKKSTEEKPFFLYVPLPSPHKPVIPTPEFQGSSKIGPYGDFVQQVDAAVGRIANAIEKSEKANNTILIVTSDNGSFMRRVDDPQFRDHTDNNSVQAYRTENHAANGPWRGTKADIWEAGHRVPFIVRFPNTVAPNTRCDSTICLVDILATVCELSNSPFDADSSEDSFSFADALSAPQTNLKRVPVIHHSINGTFAIRRNKWKLVLGNGSGGRQSPKGKPFGKPYHLFDLSTDPGESQNLVDKHPEIVKQLINEFERISHGDHQNKSGS